MFNETKNRALGEMDRLLEGEGADSNAATWTDWTHYHSSLPKRALSLCMELEADRMQNLVIKKAQVESEREVVMSERRDCVDDDVEGSVSEELYKRALPKSHPYAWPTIGWMRDIRGYERRDCDRFYRTYYAPNNAHLVAVGDFDERAFLEKVVALYGKMKRARIPAKKRYVERRQRKEKRATLTRHTETKKIAIGYRGPAFATPRWQALRIAEEILVGRSAARLRHRMVSEDESARVVRGGLAPWSRPALFEFWIDQRDNRESESLLRVVDEELARFASKGPSEAELARAKSRVELDLLCGMETANGKAEQIGFYETVCGDAAEIFTRLAAYRDVSADEVTRAAQETFVASQRTVLFVSPRERR